ncbi:MAG TPA: S8 family peptidase [Thermoanaerobaculia bacterium]|jgi:hypothetical protein|nr:S8 family peptidase [Thermoanaerobaculia bacterium]
MKRTALFALAALCLAAPLYAGSGKIEKKNRKIRDHYLVMFDDSFQPNVKQLTKELGGKHAIKILSVWEDGVRGMAIETTEKVAEVIARDPRVASIEEDQEIDLDCVGDCRNKQLSSRCADGKVPWQLDRIDQRALPMDNKYISCASGHGEGVRAYVVDSGVVQLHTDFFDANGVTRVVTGRNFTSIAGPFDTEDCMSHGTAAASVLAGLTGGVAKAATIVPVKVKDCNDGGSNQKIIDALNWIIQDHQTGQPAVANISLQAAGGTSTLMDTAVNNLIADGVFVAISAGNNNTNACNYSPSRVPNAFVVGATTRTDARALSGGGSNYGPCVTMYAPGEGIGSAQYNSLCCLNCNPGWGLTSMAAPAAAGVAAVIYQNAGYLTPAQIKQMIIDRATLNVVTGLPASPASFNRLLYAAEPMWCQPIGMCYSPPPCTPPES